MKSIYAGILPILLCAACSSGNYSNDAASANTDPSYDGSKGSSKGGKAGKAGKSSGGEVISPVTIHATSTPSWDMKGGCVHNVTYLSTDTKWSNIGTYQDPPSYRYEIAHTPSCKGKVVFHWDGSPNDSVNRDDSFAEIDLKQY